MLGLVRAFDRYAEIVGLTLRQRLEACAKLAEMQPRNLLIEMLRQRMHTERIALRIIEQLDLRNRLIREAVRHDEARVSGRATQIDEPTLGEQQNAVPIGERDLVHLWLDLFPLVLA